MTEHELLAAKLENASDISLHVWDPIYSWSEEVSLTGDEQSAIVAALREIERLQDAKRAALKLADERAKEANGLRAKLSKANERVAEMQYEAGMYQSLYENSGVKLASARKALEFYADGNNWMREAACDPNSSRFRGTNVAVEALSSFVTREGKSK